VTPMMRTAFIALRPFGSCSGFSLFGGYGSLLSIGKQSDAVLRTAMGTTQSK
jgi:hypothetical protein